MINFTSIKKTLFLFVLLMAIACTPPKPESNQTSEPFPELSKKLDEYFTVLSELKQFNGGVLVQKEGSILLRETYNMEGDENSSLRVNKNSQFDVHSISKLMAKACIVKLEGEQLINRADKLSKYLPDFPKGDKISIQHLLDNQSGLPRGFSKEHENLIDKTPAEIVTLIKEETFLFEPGTDAVYSNLGYQLVYYIIAEITGKPFVQYLKEAFFDPLGMDNSGAHFYLDKSNLQYAVKNHENDDGEIVVVPNYSNESKNQARVYSTMDDLLKFINYVKEEPYRTPLTNKAGFIGWSGGGDGILSHAAAMLQSDYELIFFSNYDEIPFGKILETVEKIMTGQDYTLPKEINRKAVQLDRPTMERFVGKYAMVEFNNDEFEIRVEDDQFIFYQNGERGAILQAENDSTLFEKPTDENYFIIREGEDGEHSLVYKYKGVDVVGKKK